MLRGYGSAREHLGDIVALTEAMFAWLETDAGTGDDAALRLSAERAIEIARLEDMINARLAATEALLPLPLACERFGLTGTETSVLNFLVAREVSPQRHRPRPTIGLLEKLIYRTPPLREQCVLELSSDSALFVNKLAEITTGPDVSWLETPVRAVPRVIELALGRLRLDLAVARCCTLIETPAAADNLLVNDELRATVDDAIHAQLKGPAPYFYPVPFLVGASGSGRSSLVGGAAKKVGLPILAVHASTLPRDVGELEPMLRAVRREATLFSAVLVVRDLHTLVGDEGRNISNHVPRVVESLVSHSGPIAMISAQHVWPAATMRPAHTIDVPVPTEAERTTLFERELDDRALAEAAAARYRITGGLIERASRGARVHADTRKRPVELGDLRLAVRTLLDTELSTLGRLVEWKQTWEDLVLPEDIHEELRELISRVRHRKRVLDEWGFARKVGRGTGMSALFSGAPGTGKTMVAGLIAAELGLDLYQIDTSRLVSKWVGETEKNLARLFDAAAAGHAVLLFDEADSLFAKRTEVKSSNDRYANLEVNYLLQRMEAFDGISILTTNLETSVDEAFRRRLAFRITFPLPEVEEREKLWRAMLPAQARIAPGLDFKSLANRYEMSGGYIRNAVLRAAYLAAADGGEITQRHLNRAAVLEYTAMGKIIQHHSSSL